MKRMTFSNKSLLPSSSVETKHQHAERKRSREDAYQGADRSATGYSTVHLSQTNSLQPLATGRQLPERPPKGGQRRRRPSLGRDRGGRSFPQGDSRSSTGRRRGEMTQHCGLAADLCAGEASTGRTPHEPGQSPFESSRARTGVGHDGARHWYGVAPGSTDAPNGGIGRRA